MNLPRFCAAIGIAVMPPVPLHAEPASNSPPPAEAQINYVEREVLIPTPDGSGVLGGTVTRPRGNGPFPGAIFLSVAGPNDRNQTVGDLAGFRNLAHYLASRGIASVRFDDRGVGASTGDYFAFSWEELARDAAGVYDFLAAEPAIDRERIGFLGMSQGAALAAMASELRPDGAFVILLSAPGLPGRESLRQQLETMMEHNGVRGEVANRYRAMFKEFIGIVSDTESDAAVRRQRMLAFLAGPGRQLIPPYKFVPREDEALADMLLGSWYQSNAAFAPAKVYGSLNVPVLAIGGGKDVISPPNLHLNSIRAMLVQAPTKDATTIWFESGNHLLQVSGTGLPAEYPLLSHAMSPEIMAMIADWVAYRFRPRAR
jgi:uncharacterized protein